MRVGILGGTFDPPHVGHWLAAVDAYEALELDRLVFVPAAQQPLKVGERSAPAADRLAMVRAMAAGDPRFEVDPIEIDRQGLSFTVDTLEAYRRRSGVDELFFIVGADVMASFNRWREPDRVQQLATLVVLRRDSDAVALPEGVTALVLESRRVDVSATEVRARVRAGRPVRGFVSDAVASYIATAGLYSQRNHA
ncbi:MAG TPA: nicotinate-nucleotide adenylyltransferase [Gemmatimonadaceae bacterium]|nr:nicotinate-nucleotide adenylyltransferase [Gemmatimonadaceae bacterium]